MSKLQEERKRERAARERGYHRKRKEKRRTYVEKNWEKIKMQQRLAYHRMTQDQYDALLKEQDGACAICKTKDWGRRSPHIDHNHKTGKTRGLLCSRCNSGIGMFKDDPKRCRSAADYLSKKER